MIVGTVTVGETFFLEKKIGSRGEAFGVASRQILNKREVQEEVLR